MTRTVGHFSTGHLDGQSERGMMDGDREPHRSQRPPGMERPETTSTQTLQVDLSAEHAHSIHQHMSHTLLTTDIWCSIRTQMRSTPARICLRKCDYGLSLFHLEYIPLCCEFGMCNYACMGSSRMDIIY